MKEKRRDNKGRILHTGAVSYTHLENAKDDMVNQIGSQFMTTLLTSSMQGKNPTEMIESLKQLQNLADELKK